MVVRLRLARWGRKDVPFYRIVAADARAPRDGRHLEILGTFNPIAAKDGVKELRVNTERLRYWIGVGAQPSDRVSHLMGVANVLPMPPTRQYTKKCVPRKERKAEAKTSASAAAAAKPAKDAPNDQAKAKPSQ